MEVQTTPLPRRRKACEPITPAEARELNTLTRGLPVLRFGDGGMFSTFNEQEPIEHLHDLLEERGLYEGGMRGDYTAATEDAVMRFQERFGLHVDGVCGPLTWAALLSETATPAQLSYWLPWYDRDAGYWRALEDEVHALKGYAVAVRSAARQFGIPAAVVAGLLSRQSCVGLGITPEGPEGTTVQGGRGLMALGAERFAGFCAQDDWKDASLNIRYGAANLAMCVRRLNVPSGPHTLSPRALLRAAIAAFDCGTERVRRALALGESVDFFTEGRSFSADVLRRAGFFQQNDEW